MSRQTPNRNQRSKGIKVKHVLQIFLLLAVCFWLIYQVKHSHDKKKEFDESDAKALISRGGSGTFIRLGRKDIHPQEEDTITKNEKHDEEAEEEEETTGVVDENKHEEDGLEDKKVEDTENEKVESGDDEIEDRGQEKIDSEIDSEEEFVDGEKERDDDDENENEEKDPEDGQMEKESFIEKGDHDGDDTGTHEAREEHYKADDASSAVTHDTQVETTERENQNDENVNGHPNNILAETDMGGEKRKELEEGGEMALDEKHSNVTIGEDKQNVMDGSENGSSLNTMVTEVSDDHLKTGNSSTEISTETNDQEILSEGTSLERSNLQSIDEQANNSTLVIDDNHFASNSTNLDETKDAESKTLKSSEMSNNTNSSTETNDAIDAEKSYAEDGANESLESENTENSEEIQPDSIDVSDSSHSLEETNARLDPDTLPEIQTGGSNTEDIESE
ncbi:uncharacterized protein [Primulina huaijiensis]|uniref:uncharacterized protein n=1 Tax=Primulina huaijiensis TaxID=1492673 RepID=UPI003CC73736